MHTCSRSNSQNLQIRITRAREFDREFASLKRRPAVIERVPSIAHLYAMYYFGYGSNMLTPRIQGRVPAAEPIGSAKLQGARVAFHKQSSDGSGKCNVVCASAHEHVHGVLFDVSSANLEALDAAEQRGKGYERRPLTLQSADGKIDAFAYVAQPAHIDNALHPYEWYLKLVLAGARQHELPEPYITQLRTTQAYPDPNQVRRETHEELLRAANVPPVYPPS